MSKVTDNVELYILPECLMVVDLQIIDLIVI